MPSEAIKQTVRNSYKRLGQQLAAFVPRKEQNYLVAEIVKTLCGEQGLSQRILVAEAGTGIGKSLAYAQGAIPCALALRKKLVISTATLSLQEQLINKDLPFYQSISTQNFTFTLVKGRQRYCCQHRLQRLATEEKSEQLSFSELLEFQPDEAQRTLCRELWSAWQQHQWLGDRDSWPSSIPDPLWDAISAERHICNPIFGHHQTCPFHQARSRLDEFDVLVVNHALLLADLSLGGGVVLPAPDDCIYVLDEAHHLPGIARDQGAAAIHISSLLSWLGKLPQFGDRITKLMHKDGGHGLLEQITSQSYVLQQNTRTWQQQLDMQTGWFAEQSEYRFEQAQLPSLFKSLVSENLEAANKVRKVLDRWQLMLTEKVKSGEVHRREGEAVLAELGQSVWRCEQMQDLWQLFHRTGGPLAKWVEKLEGPSEYQLHAVPLEMGDWLERLLWSRCFGAILVSATLTALNKFDYFRRQAGLPEPTHCRYLRLKSPFDYQKSTLHIPDLGCDPSDANYTEQLIQHLPRFLKGQQASLVLFASYRQMEAVAKGLRAQGWSLLVQGEASRHALLTLHRDRCQHQQASILFGTGSFSEGLDLPGDLLTNLIITKLPFAVPTSPIETAQAEWVEQHGGNPFLQITIPEASRKLIQACGRLVRKEDDSGNIVLLDRRIRTRRYGKALLDALPPFRRSFD